MKRIPQLHWTLERAASEFDINPRTLSKNLKTLAAEPAFEDGSYSTQQICRAVYGDLEGEKLRKIREEADEIALRNEENKKRLVDMAYVCQKTDPIYIAMKQKILSSKLSDSEKDDLLNELAKLHTFNSTETERLRNLSSEPAENPTPIPSVDPARVGE